MKAVASLRGSASSSCESRRTARAGSAITEELSGHSFTANTISQSNEGLDQALERFALRALEAAYPSISTRASRRYASTT